MAGAAPTYPPLDLDALRIAVAAGRMVRVGVLPTGQFPDGTAGRVRTVGAPDVDGPEFIQVELTVGGAKDVIPFAPTDLSPLRRGQAAPEPVARAVAPRRPRRSAAERSDATGAVSGPVAAGAGAPALPAPSLTLVPPPPPSARAGAGSGMAPPAGVRAAGGASAPAGASAAAGMRAAGGASAPAGASAAATGDRSAGLFEAATEPKDARPDADPGPAGSTAPSIRTPTRARRTSTAAVTPDPAASNAGGAPTSALIPTQTLIPTPPAAPPRRPTDRGKRQQITVTLSTAGPEHTSWTVQVTVGSRAVVKPSVVPPAQAWTVVTGLGHPEVEKHVAGALAEHRRQTQDRADRLARELAEARAELAGYPDV